MILNKIYLKMLYMFEIKYSKLQIQIIQISNKILKTLTFNFQNINNKK